MRGILLFGALPLAFLLVPVAAARGQRAHDGPAKAIERAKTSPAFDVVSVKEDKSGGTASFDIDGRTGILTAVDMPLEGILGVAYDVKPDQIVGLKGPVRDARFDITAKMLPDAATRAALPTRPDGYLEAMMVLLLEDRFHLQAHVEQRVKPVYELVVARGGSKIQLSTGEIHFSNCNLHRQGTAKVISGKNCTMADVAAELSDGVDRMVIDKTGLAGHSDINLKWSDDVALGVDQAVPDTVSVFTAVEEQLGLKLQPSKGPVETLVIDHAEMPSGN